MTATHLLLLIIFILKMRGGPYMTPCLVGTRARNSELDTFGQAPSGSLILR